MRLLLSRGAGHWSWPVRFRRTLLVAVAVALTSAAAWAQEFTSPEDLLGTLYGVYLAGGSVDRLDPYFSDRLTAALSTAHLNVDIVRLLGLVALTGTEAPGVLTVFNLQSATEAFTAEAVVSFRNGDGPVSVTFDLGLESADGWQIDHIKGVSGTTSWCSGEMMAKAQLASPDLGKSAE